MITRVRDRQEKPIAVVIEEFPSPKLTSPSVAPVNESKLLGGVTVEPIPKDFARGKSMVFVSEIIPESLSDTRGLEEGDGILGVNQVPMYLVKDFEQGQGMRGLKNHALLFLRRGQVAMLLSIYKDESLIYAIIVVMRRQ